jgi:uncharacterized protein (TIGR03083 family)
MDLSRLRPMATGLDYLDHLARDSARFAEALRTADAGAPVPSCPGWKADDLLWHLAEVQWFWGTVARERVRETAVAEALEVSRPAQQSDLEDFYHEASRDLQDVLAATAPETEVWTWSSDHTIGFIRRRQAHEALIHRVDAELTAGERTAMDADLSADGVDEVLRIMYGGAPAWGEFTPDGRTLGVIATDTRDSWRVALGWFSGTDPDSAKRYDQADLRAVRAEDVTNADATISGTAADLDCWLWHRTPMEAPERAGDHAVLEAFDAVVAAGID